MLVALPGSATPMIAFRLPARRITDDRVGDGGRDGHPGGRRVRRHVCDPGRRGEPAVAFREAIVLLADGGRSPRRRRMRWSVPPRWGA